MKQDKEASLEFELFHQSCFGGLSFSRSSVSSYLSLSQFTQAFPSNGILLL